MSYEFGLYGLAVMGQNFALNIAEHGFKIAVSNRSANRVDDCVARAQAELGDKADNLVGFKDPKDFVAALAKPRKIMFLVKAGAPVDECVSLFSELLEPGDILIDGGNEWFENSIRRAKQVEPKGIIYMAMGISGGEEGARNGPSLMPGGPVEGFKALEPIITQVAAQTDSGACTTYIGGPGSGNYVKMVHNGIEYGDMQLIAEAASILKDFGGLNNQELSDVFASWNQGKLKSFLIEITSIIYGKRDTDVYTTSTPPTKHTENPDGYIVDVILDRTGNKGTGKMTIKEGAERSIPVGTMAAALDARFISADKDNRVQMSQLLPGNVTHPVVDREQLIKDVETALYCSKICSYAQGLNLIRQTSSEYKWGVNLGECARIWKGGCIIRAQFLDSIKQAYDRDPSLPSLLVDSEFSKEIIEGQAAWRRVVSLCALAGQPIPAMYSSLGYFDAYRSSTLATASLVQAQRDFFGSHTFERTDRPAGEFFHCKWTDAHAI
eukprot:c1307_g1_i1.p1 GENE.c1307_g1_i1~~c1307_g1_i1.p1  ORF type:complete len:509 (+),score=121.39 c1307_g1_i1:43-1527(+)